MHIKYRVILNFKFNIITKIYKKRVESKIIHNYKLVFNII